MAEAQELAIVIPGRPVPKGRPRFGRGRVYTPKKTKDYEQTVCLFAKLAMKKQKMVPFVGPVAVSVKFFLNQPLTNRPDLDNLGKALWDGLEKAGIFKDEQIYMCVMEKRESVEEGAEVMRMGEG